MAAFRKGEPVSFNSDNLSNHASKYHANDPEWTKYFGPKERLQQAAAKTMAFAHPVDQQHTPAQQKSAEKKQSKLSFGSRKLSQGQKANSRYLQLQAYIYSPTKIPKNHFTDPYMVRVLTHTGGHDPLPESAVRPGLVAEYKAMMKAIKHIYTHTVQKPTTGSRSPASGATWSSWTTASSSLRLARLFASQASPGRFALASAPRSTARQPTKRRPTRCGWCTARSPGMQSRMWCPRCGPTAGHWASENSLAFLKSSR